MVWRALHACGRSRAPASLSLSQRDAAEHERPSPRSGRRMFDAELADDIRRQIDTPRLHGEGYRKLWARPDRPRPRRPDGAAAGAVTIAGQRRDQDADRRPVCAGVQSCDGSGWDAVLRAFGLLRPRSIRCVVSHLAAVRWSRLFDAVTPPLRFVTVRMGSRAISMENSQLHKRPNLSKCNSWQTQPRISHRARGRAAHRGRQAEPLRASGRHGHLGRLRHASLQRWLYCAGTTSTSPPGDCMCAGPRLGMPACIRYQPGKAGHCASSCARHQHHPTSSSRNVAHRFPQPDISAWWPGRAWLRNSPFSLIPTCCGTPAGSSSPTTATTLAPSRPISATARSCPRCAMRL